MSRITAPLLSLGARGQIGKGIVFGSWRGIPYARQYVVPANPRTVGQTLTRNVFANLDDQFKRMLTLAQAPFHAAAKGRPLTGRNVFLRDNVSALRPEADMALYVASGGVNGGLPGLNFTAAGGALSGEIDIDIDIGQNPVGWSADSVSFTVFPDRDPATAMTGFVDEASEVGPGDTYSPPVNVAHTFTGLTGGSDYVCSAWILWTRSDGELAYGPASTAIATATV